MPTSVDEARLAGTLYMMWGDAAALCELLRVSRMSEDEFMASPMSRSAVCSTLGPLIARAASLGEDARRTLAGVDWELLMSPGDLSDPRTPYVMDPTLARRTWLAASSQAEPVRRALANDPRVVRERARVDAVMARPAGDWPQPGRCAATAETAARDPMNARLAQAFALFAEGAAGAGDGGAAGGGGSAAGDAGTGGAGAGALPVRRAWLLVGEPSPVLVLEDGPGMDDAWATRLAQALGDACGTEVSLIPQAQVHPAIWDDVTAREALLWERVGAPHDPCVPMAVRERDAHGGGHHDGCGCGHHHEHGHECGCEHGRA